MQSFEEAYETSSSGNEDFFTGFSSLKTPPTPNPMEIYVRWVLGRHDKTKSFQGIFWWIPLKPLHTGEQGHSRYYLKTKNDGNFDSSKQNKKIIHGKSLLVS